MAIAGGGSPEKTTPTRMKANTTEMKSIERTEMRITENVSGF